MDVPERERASIARHTFLTNRASHNTRCAAPDDVISSGAFNVKIALPMRLARARISSPFVNVMADAVAFAKHPDQNFQNTGGPPTWKGWGDRCEYCHLSAQLQRGGFEVDHISPRARGGRTEMMHVAVACLLCNAHKSAYSDGKGPMSGQRVAPFNPRTQRWEKPVLWSVHRVYAIVRISPPGRTTVARLQMSQA
jgi:hypothetical protein